MERIVAQLLDLLSASERRNAQLSKELARKKRRVTLALSAAGFFLLSGLAGLVAVEGAYKPPASLARAQARRSPGMLSLPSAHPVGLTRHGGRWLALDWMDGRMIELDLSAGARALGGFPNPYPSGLSAGADCLWSVSAFHDRLYRHHPETLAVYETAPTPGTGASALHWDGAHLWLADKDSRQAFRYESVASTGSALTPFALLEVEPVGLWKEGESLWALDRARKTVRRYRIGRALSPVDYVELSDWLPEPSRPVGLAVTDEEILILADKPAILYRQRRSELDWQPAPAATPEPAAAAPAAPAAAAPAAPAPAERRHRLRRGDTLWRLSREFYGDPKKWTAIRDANLAVVSQGLPEGQTLLIPR